ncbi:hypothetical protein [Maridesulfovibrio sp.]|uniref:hypothetical protein n=1 Tax=Maridesulfovibrio sp. TaxID=2795000 RepID=UPI003BA84BD3
MPNSEETHDRVLNYERCMVSILNRTINEKGLTHSAVAREAWPYLKSPADHWRRARNARKNEAPRKMPLRDLVAMAQTLQLSFIQLCAEVELELKKGWDYHKDDTIKN